MPYLRLHLPTVSMEQKRFLAQRLIEITLRAFHLRSGDRYRISVEFVSHSWERSADRFWPWARGEPKFTLEVLGHGMTKGEQQAFSEEASDLLAQTLPMKSTSLLDRLLGIETDAHCQIAFQFGELSAAVSEPYVIHADSVAA